ncbi:MAG: ATP-binding protein [Phycisphaerales bacterium]
MLSRNIEPQLRAALADTPVVLIHGARQTGKTTLARSVAHHSQPRRYLTLDDATTLAAATSDPTGFLASLEGPIVIDEVQRAADLFRAIKADVDRNRKPGRFLLTGSANVLLLPKLSESLAGRIEIITLWPLSQGEIDAHPEKFIDAVFAPKLPAITRLAKSSPDLLTRILRGGYPEPLSRKDDARRSAWYASYITTILQRDVRDLSNIEGLSDLPRLLSLLASRTSGLLNFSDLARSLSLPQTTLKRYFALLEATFLVVSIPAWSSNQGLRLSKSPKIMLADTGLACHLLGADKARLAADGHAKGTLLENFVAMELLKQSGWSRTRTTLHHFRTTNGREVDLVLEDPAGRLVGIEIKSAATVTNDDFKGLRALQEAAGPKFHRGIILHDGAEIIPFDKQMAAMPVGAVWGL